MANAFWCIVEDDRQGTPKKVMAEVIGEAARLSSGQAETVWFPDKATGAGRKQLAEWGANKVWLCENAAFAPYRGEIWTGAAAELAAKATPRAILAPVTSRQREFVARLAARLGVGLAADCVAFDGRRRSEEHTSELQSQSNLVCRLLLEKKKDNDTEEPLDHRPGL